ncbi:MAG: hypothetical protein KDD44_14705, partial [Bdellovibrionales bacterium]|nr:hypothetical protein [Bdellovibrionales bacterium]
MSEPATPSASVAQLNLLLLLSFALAMLLASALKDDADLYWQIRIGQEMLASGQLFPPDTISYQLEGHKLRGPATLAQLLLAFLYHRGGLQLVRALHFLCYTIAFFVAGLLSLRMYSARTGRWPLAMGWTLCVLPALSSASIRPHCFGLLGFSLALYLIRTARFSLASVVLLFILTVVWQNMHASVSVLVLSLIALIIAGLFSENRPRLLRERSVYLLTVSFAQLFTPLGFDVFSVTSINLRLSRELLGISEWLPPWNPLVAPAMTGFWFSAALGCVGLLLFARRISYDDRFLFLALTVQTMYASRLVIFWSVASVPLFVQMGRTVLPRYRRKSHEASQLEQ